MANNLVEDIIKTANIVDIVGRFVKLTKKGANYFGLCPFHADTHATNFSVSPTKGIFRCFSCGAAGNVITFIQKIKHLSYGEAIKETARLAGFSEDAINEYFAKQNKNYNSASWRLFTVNTEANDLFKRLLFDNDNKQYLDYLLNRKLSINTIKKFDIGFCGKNGARQIAYDLLANPSVNPQAKWNEDDLLKTSLITINEKSGEISDYFFNRITFPIKDKNGFITGFIARDIAKDTQLKYLSSRETTLFSKTRTLYNFERVCQEQPETLIVLEGNIDLISLYEAGMDESKYGAVALMGTALTQNHINMIARSGFIKNLILWFDNDDPGKASTITNGLQLLKTGLNVFVAVNDTANKDVNDILVNIGNLKVLDIINDPNKPDFITYYINHNLANVNATNMVSKVEDVLSLINRYGNSLLWSKYAQLISSLTKLSVDDINATYKRIAGNRFSANKPREWNKEETKVVSNPILKNLIETFNILIKSLIYEPVLSANAYTALRHKQCNISLISDYIYFIKRLSFEEINDRNKLESIQKIIQASVEEKKISSSSGEQLLKLLTIQKQKIDSHVPMKSGPSNVDILVQHIDFYFDELIERQLLEKISDPNLDEHQKARLEVALDEVRENILEFKKRKTKRFADN